MKKSQFDFYYESLKLTIVNDKSKEQVMLHKKSDQWSDFCVNETSATFENFYPSVPLNSFTDEENIFFAKWLLFTGIEMMRYFLREETPSYNEERLLDGTILGKRLQEIKQVGKIISTLLLKPIMSIIVDNYNLFNPPLFIELPK